MNTASVTKKVVATGGLTAMVAGSAIVSAQPANAAPANPSQPMAAGCHVTVIPHYGMHGHYVKVVQQRLNKRGYHLSVDSSFGPATNAAVRSFQRSKHLQVDGHVGPVTWKHLGGFPGCGHTTPPKKHPKKYPVLRYGDTGSAVRTAQKLLNSHLGGHNIAIDGSFGPATLTQVKRFQRVYPHTAVDGVINKNDWKQLRGPVRHPKKPKPPKKHQKTYAGWVAATDHAANVRSGPGMKYRVVGHRAKHSYVKGTVYSRYWIKLSPGHYLNKGVLETQSSNVHGINGRMNKSQLCAIPHKYNTPDSFAPGYTKNTTRYMNCHALPYLKSLETMYHKRFGKYALIDLAYRTYKEQVYWYNKLGYPRAAIPGTSNHGLGQAIDFTERRAGHFGWGGYGNKWLLAHAGPKGFANPFTPYTSGESYHFNFVG